MNVGDLVDGGFADIKTGPFGTQLRASDYVESGRPVLNVRNVGFGDVRARDLDFVNEETATRLAGHLLQVNDIVFGRKGAVERHAFIGPEFAGAMQGSDCIRLRVSENSPVPAAFITFALRTKQHQAWMQAFSSHGATMASLNQEIVRQISLPDVSREEQVLAVEVLQTIDQLIQNNMRRVEVLEQMARAVYREWFVKFRYPGHESVPLVGSALGPIPDGWRSKSVRELSSIVSRGIAPKYSPDGPTVVLNQKCIRDGRVSFSLARRQEKSIPAPKRVRRGDVLINSTGVGTLGRVGLYRGSRDGVTVDSHVTIARPSDSTLNPWYGMSLVAKQREFERLGTGSTGQTELSRSDIGATNLAMPGHEVLAAFSAVVWPLMDEIDALLTSNESTSALRDLLLPPLVTGRIDVSALDLSRIMEGAMA